MNRTPDSYEALVGWLLLALGGVFFLLGTLGRALSIPVRGGSPETFSLFALPLLLTGGGLLWRDGQRKRTWRLLRVNGQATSGQLTAVRCHWYTSWGSEGLRKRHPWSVTCRYRWEGQTYTVRSTLLWRRPSETDQHPTVWLDPANPQTAWLDPDSLRYEL